MHSLFATHGPALLPFFDLLLPTFSAMLVSVKWPVTENCLYIHSVNNLVDIICIFKSCPRTFKSSTVSLQSLLASYIGDFMGLIVAISRS